MARFSLYIKHPCLTRLLRVLQLTAAGRRVLHLLEEEWMTDETFTPTSSNSQHTVRGFHGDYEVTVLYKGSAKSSLTQRFTLGKAAHAVTIHVTA